MLTFEEDRQGRRHGLTHGMTSEGKNQPLAVLHEELSSPELQTSLESYLPWLDDCIAQECLTKSPCSATHVLVPCSIFLRLFWTVGFLFVLLTTHRCCFHPVEFPLGGQSGSTGSQRISNLLLVLCHEVGITSSAVSLVSSQLTDDCVARKGVVQFLAKETKS